MRLLRELIFPIGREQDGDHSLPGARDASRRLDPADAGHVDVEPDLVLLERPCELDGLLARFGLADQLEAGSRAEHRPGR